MYGLWIKKVCIKSPVIGLNRNPLVTHADFDYIPPVCGEYHNQYHYAMGIVRTKRVYFKIPSINEHAYIILLKTVQCTDYNLFVNENMASTITQNI